MNENERQGFLLHGVSLVNSNSQKLNEKISKKTYKQVELFFTVQNAITTTQDINEQKQEAVAFFQTLEILHKKNTLIPFRFKTVLLKEHQLNQLLEEKYEAIYQKLSEVNGHSEFSLKILSELPESHDEIGKSSTGKDYMHQKLKKFKVDNAIDQQVQLMQKSLKDEITAISKGVLTESKSNRLLQINILLNDTKVHHYKLIIEEFQKKYPTSKYLSSGPWPIFNFGNFLDF